MPHYFYSINLLSYPPVSTYVCIKPYTLELLATYIYIHTLHTYIYIYIRITPSPYKERLVL